MTNASVHSDTAHSSHGDSRPGGLMVSEHGYTLEIDSGILPTGQATVTFHVTGPDGKPVTEYGPTHDKELHFIAVRRDTAGFQHVHPTMDASGIWTTQLELTAGVWRLFADFRPADHDETMTLGVDLSVAGDYDPQSLPEVRQTAQVGDYTVTLDGRIRSGTASELAFNVSRGGRSVTDLEPYLSAYGHLVALRAGDLAYLHVHPEGEPGDGTTEPGPDISFLATAPSAGAYRLFLDFKHDGVVRTAEFTVHATGAVHGSDPGSTSGSTPATPPGGERSGDHEHH
jgi:hypothetical protein